LTKSEVIVTTLDADVIVVGAGPTGLLLPGDLAAAGVRCTVLERRRDEPNTTRAVAVHARTLEELDARGLEDQLIATGSQVRELRLAWTGEVHDLSGPDGALAAWCGPAMTRRTVTR
jgi:2-polyprenyl-6-methoxyphenol hydroxylase-like FAD-dependent oxidoreductase